MRRVPSILLASAAVAALGAGVALSAPGDTTLVSAASAGVPGDAAAVSADGRFVAFTAGVTPQLFVRDRVLGTTAPASTNAAGVAANAAVDTEDVANVQFAISGSGRYVVFASTATNLATQDTDANKDVFRKDLTTGAVDLISVNTAGQKANTGVFGDPDVSYDGNRVSFGSGTATNLGGGGAVSSIMVRDVAAGTTVLAAQNNAGVEANGTTERSAISADGRAVAFEAPAGTTNLAPDDTGAGNDVYVRNLVAGATTPASVPSTPANGSGFPDISGDGRYVTLTTPEPYDATNDANAGNDVYRRDMTAATGFAVVSAINAADTAGNGNSDRSAISADGSRVAFRSASTNLTAADANAALQDIYTRDLATKLTRRASSASNGTDQSGTDAPVSALGGSGSLVAFVTTDDATHRLVPADANALPDVLAKELAPTDTTGPAIQISSTTAAATGALALVVTATDPSGVGSVVANGVALRPGAGTTFTGTAPVAAGAPLKIEARDGSGNAATLTVVPAATGPGGLPSSLKPPKVTNLRAKLVKGRIVVTLRLDTAARVKAQLQRRTVRIFKKAPKRRVIIRSVGKVVTRNLAAGTRTITVKPPKLRKKVKYTVRLRAATTAGTTTRTVAITVPAALPLRKK